MVNYVNFPLLAPPSELPYFFFHSYFDTPQPDGRKRLYEVHFPHNYVPHHPQGITPPVHTSLVLPVSVVCHATHKEQASQIVLHREVGGYYRFTPHNKPGKSYIEDGCSLGESYRCAQDGVLNADTPCYQSIPDTGQVFPGYYSWWGLASPGLTPDQETCLSRITSSPPPYLKTPPESVYGGYAFESKFSDLLQSYASSRGCVDIYLKVGGTLRYKCEIAYVVIVCTSRDLGALNSYCPLTRAPHDVFKHNGLVDDGGKVVNIARGPNFTTCYVDTYSSYETLNFAFYFSSPLADFRCLSSTVEERLINHSFCIRKSQWRPGFIQTLGNLTQSGLALMMKKLNRHMPM